MSLIILGHAWRSWLGGGGRKRSLVGNQQLMRVLEYSKVFWQIRWHLNQYSQHFFALGIHLAARSAKGRALLIVSASWYLRDLFYLWFDTSPFLSLTKDRRCPSEMWEPLAETASLKVNFLVIRPKTDYGEYETGFSRVVGHGQPASLLSGEFEVARLNAFELLVHFQSIASSLLLLLEFTQWREVCWTNSQLP